MDIHQALGTVASGGSRLDLSDLKALRFIVHFAIDHADFPSDEDVEVAATAVYALDWGNHPADMNDAVLNKSREQARAALLAVADARRTEEEG